MKAEKRELAHFSKNETPMADRLAYGHLEVADATIISGWAIDDDFDGPLGVHLYVDDRLTTTGIANFSTITHGDRGFYFITPKLEPGTHKIAVYAKGLESDGSESFWINMDSLKNPMMGTAAFVTVDPPAGFIARQNDIPAIPIGESGLTPVEPVPAPVVIPGPVNRNIPQMPTVDQQIRSELDAMGPEGGTIDLRRYSGDTRIYNYIDIDKPARIILASGRYEFVGRNDSSQNPFIFRLLSRGSSIEGQGIGVTIVEVTSPEKDIAGVITFSQTKVSDLSLVGNLTDGPAAINSGSSSYVEIARVRIEKWFHGINTGGFSSSFDFHDNIVTNNAGDGILIGLSSHHMKIHYNTFHDNGSNGIDLNGNFNSVAYNVVTKNGEELDARQDGWDCWGILIAALSPAAPYHEGCDADYNLVFGNTVDGNQCSGIFVWSGLNHRAKGNVIQQNNVINTKDVVHGNGVVLMSEAGGEVSNTFVIGNNLSSNGHHGFLGYCPSGICANNLVSGNTILGNLAGAILEVGGPGVTFSNNTID